MSGWKARKKELEQSSDLKVSYDEVEEEEDFQVIYPNSRVVSHEESSNNTVNGDGDFMRNEQSGAIVYHDDEDLESEDLYDEMELMTKKISNLVNISVDSFSHESLVNEFDDSVTFKHVDTAASKEFQAKQSHSVGVIQVQAQKNLPETPIISKDIQSASKNPSVDSKPLPKPTPPIPKLDVKTKDQKKVETPLSASAPAITDKNLEIVTANEIELLKQQVSRLQLRNLELLRELHAKKSNGSSLLDIIENNDNANESYDEYFRVSMPPEVKPNVNLDNVNSIKNGLFSCDISKVVITSNTKTYFYNRNDDDFENSTVEKQLTIVNKLKKELYSKSLNDPSLLNFYEFDSNELEKQQLRAWCDIRTLKSIEDKKELLYSCHYDDSKSYLNSNNDRGTDNDKFPMHHDAVLSTLLTMEQSLSFRAFMKCISGEGNRVYLDAYIGHLSVLQDYEKLVRVYKYNKMFYQIFLLEYREAISTRDPRICIQKLERLLNVYKLGTADNLVAQSANSQGYFAVDYAQHIVDLINLLSRQIKVEEHDSRIAMQGKELIYIEYPRYNIIGLSILETLKYCLFYHPYAEENKLSSPKSIAQAFKISRHRYLFEATRMRCKMRDWKAVELLYKTAVDENLCYVSSYEHLNRRSSATGFLKSKFSGRKNSLSILSVSSFLQLIVDHKGPPTLIEYLIRQCPDPEEKFALARKNQLYQLAVECVTRELKDKELCLSLNKELVSKLGAEESQQLREQINQFLSKNEKGWLRKLF